MSLSHLAPALLAETFGNENLPLGGKHDYKGVRGGQGSKKNKYQGYTPRKRHCTKLYDTAHEAAVNLALLKRRLVEDDDEVEEITKKPRKPRADKVRATAPAHACARCAHRSSHVLRQVKPLNPLKLGMHGMDPPTPPKNSPPKMPPPQPAWYAPYSAPDPRLPIASFVMPLELMRVREDNRNILRICDMRG
jgi:hypothetical protein